MTSSRITKTRNLVATGALVLAGFGGGVLLAVGGIADATTGSSSSTSSTGTDNGHPGETPLTGTTAAKVRAAALAKYPGATVERVETDSDGGYEAHIVTEAGARLVVQVDKDFTVTGTQAGHGGRGGPGGGHGDETPLTGTTAAKVRAAALAKYPGATVERVETDSDGVYEAHIVTEAGARLVVQVDKEFTVTGTQTFTGRGPGHHDGDGPDDTASQTPDES